MKKYHVAEHEYHPTVSSLVYNRAHTLRKHNLTSEDIGVIEAILPVVSTLNAVPTLYWLLIYILERPELVNRLRQEVSPSVQHSTDPATGRKVATMYISKFESDFPLLVSCYRETMRLANHSVSNRRMVDDLTITSQDKTRSYLLKKGTDVQLPAGVPHAETSIWGADAAEFNPERFLAPTTKGDPKVVKLRKTSYIPFGGGRHLCPGRNFAFAEIIGFAATLIVGYEVEAVGMAWGEMKMQKPNLASATVKPVAEGKGQGGKIRVREGWEGVEWRFEA